MLLGSFSVASVKQMSEITLIADKRS